MFFGTVIQIKICWVHLGIINVTQRCFQLYMFLEEDQKDTGLIRLKRKNKFKHFPKEMTWLKQGDTFWWTSCNWNILYFLTFLKRNSGAQLFYLPFVVIVSFWSLETTTEQASCVRGKLHAVIVHLWNPRVSLRDWPLIMFRHTFTKPFSVWNIQSITPLGL